jgi:hypothetical protein
VAARAKPTDHRETCDAFGGRVRLKQVTSFSTDYAKKVSRCVF